MWKLPLAARLLQPLYFILYKNKSLRYPLFNKYLLYRLCIILSLNMQATIIAYFAYKLTCNPVTHKGDALVLGLLGLWEVIPAIGFSLISGHFTDILEKTKLVTWCIAGYLALTAFFIALSFGNVQANIGTQHILWMVYGGVFVSGLLRAFLSPASFSLMGLLLPRKLYTNGSTWSSTAWQTGFVIGPLAGGALIAVSGFTLAQIVVAAVQVTALAAILLIPRQPVLKKEKEPILKSLGEGIRFVFNSQLILAALSLDMFAVLFGGAVALLPVYANEILHTGEVGFGWMRAAPGIGSILMLMILSVVPLNKNAGIKLLAGIAGFGITTVIFGLCGHIADTHIFGTFMGCKISQAFLLAFFMLFLGGMFDSVSVVIRSTILQLHTPDSMRGRVAAVNTMFISSSNELGSLESGVTAKWIGTVPAVVFGGCMTLLIVGVTWFTAPLLHRLKLDPGAPEKE